jgi:hypothetical protein
MPQPALWQHPAVIFVVGFCIVMALLAIADLAQGRWFGAVFKFAMAATVGLMVSGVLWWLMRHWDFSAS